MQQCRMFTLPDWTVPTTPRHRRMRNPTVSRQLTPRTRSASVGRWQTRASIPSLRPCLDRLDAIGSLTASRSRPLRSWSWGSSWGWASDSPREGHGDRPTAPGRLTTSSASPSYQLVLGDDSDFVKDVTFPDGSPVRVDQQFTKTWEIRNLGSAPWQDRYLTRQTAEDTDLCASPSRVPIRLTQPGQNVQISVTITAPSFPGSCHLDWKMTDANGNEFSPNKRVCT